MWSSSQDRPFPMISWLWSPSMESWRVAAMWIQAVLWHLARWQNHRIVKVGRGLWRSRKQPWVCQSDIVYPTALLHYFSFHFISLFHLYYFSFPQLEHCFGLSPLSLLQQGRVQDWSSGTPAQATKLSLIFLLSSVAPALAACKVCGH